MPTITTKFYDAWFGDYRSKDGRFTPANKTIEELMITGWVLHVPCEIEYYFNVDNGRNIVTKCTPHTDELIDNNRVGGTMYPQWTGD